MGGVDAVFPIGHKVMYVHFGQHREIRLCIVVKGSKCFTEVGLAIVIVCADAKLPWFFVGDEDETVVLAKIV